LAQELPLLASPTMDSQRPGAALTAVVLTLLPAFTCGSIGEDRAAAIRGFWCHPHKLPGMPSANPASTPAPTPAPILAPATLPPTSPPKPHGPQNYCPDPAEDFQEEVEGPAGKVDWSDSGWTIHGQRRVSSKASFDLRGGWVEFDMDLANAHGGVNTNLYVTFPHKRNCGIDCYCDSGPTGGCAELDFTENNGNCWQATTWHPDPSGNAKAGFGGNGPIGPQVHVKAQFTADGATLNVDVNGKHYDGPGAASEHEAWGAVIYSSQWTGWVPGSCPGDSNLQGSSFTVKNLKLHGTVRQGPTPRLCGAASAPAPAAPSPLALTPLVPAPAPTPPGLKQYCPDPAKDFQIEVKDNANSVVWSGSGWTMRGSGRVSSRASFDLRGGSVEFDMDLSGAQGGVNTNLYVTFPHKPNCGIDCYCDSGPTGGCAELDFTENNGHCWQATTWHADPSGNFKAGTGGNGPITEKVHVKAEFTADGATLNVNVNGKHYDGPGVASEHEAWGAVIYSSQWTGWVPGSCPGSGNLQASSFTVSNLRVVGKLKQGPAPTECSPSQSTLVIFKK